MKITGQFDDILSLLGTGKWNIIYFFAASSCTFWLPAIIIASTFVAPEVDHICLTNILNTTQAEGEKCSYYTTSENSSFKIKHDCVSWSYNQTPGTNSLTTQFDLVCSRAHLRYFYQVAYTFGNIIGTPVTGILSDKYGRRTIVLITSTLGTLAVLASFLVNDIVFVIFARFLYGICFHPLMLSSYTLAMEVCEPKLRPVYGILHTLPWAFGTIWWGCLGYLIRDWKLLQSAAISPIILLFIALCFMDESPRWLIVNGQLDKSLRCLKKAFNWNKRSLPSDDELMESLREIEKMTRIHKKPKDKTVPSDWKRCVYENIKKGFSSVLILFRTRELRRITCLMCFTFFVSGAVFYGMALNGSNFGLNPYLYIMVVGVTEIPAYSLTGYAIKKFGRIYPAVITLSSSGISVLALAFLPKEMTWAVILFAFLGNLAIAAGFQIIFVIGNEIFPTQVRSQGFGISHFLSSVGTILAPFINQFLGMYHSWVPALVFGIMGILASISAASLPETLERRMYESIDELEKMSIEKKVKNVNIENKESTHF